MLRNVPKQRENRIVGGLRLFRKRGLKRLDQSDPLKVPCDQLRSTEGRDLFLRGHLGEEIH